MEQIEEFDSTSSSSDSSSSESSSNESSGEDEEGESSCEAGESESQEDDAEKERVSGEGTSGLATGVAMAVSSGKGLYKRDDQESEAGGRRRKRLRKRKATGLRKKLRTHIESVEEFNPEARSAQSAELERLRRLQLQQSLTQAASMGPSPSTAQQAVLQLQHQAASSMSMQPAAFSGGAALPSQLSTNTASALPQQYLTSLLQAQGTTAAGHTPVRPSLLQGAEGHALAEGGVAMKNRSDSSSSPEVLMVDLTAAARMGEGRGQVADAIVIDSGSDSDHTNGQGQPPQDVVARQPGPGGPVGVVTPQYGSGAVAAPTRSELLNMKYGSIQPSPDGRVLVNAGHDATDVDIFLAPQIARTVKPHQVGMCMCMYGRERGRGRERRG